MTAKYYAVAIAMQRYNFMDSIKRHPEVLGLYSTPANIHDTCNIIGFLQQKLCQTTKYTKPASIASIEPVLKWQAAGRLLFWEVTLIGLNRCSFWNAAGEGGSWAAADPNTGTVTFWGWQLTSAWADTDTFSTHGLLPRLLCAWLSPSSSKKKRKRNPGAHRQQPFLSIIKSPFCYMLCA